MCLIVLAWQAPRGPAARRRRQPRRVARPPAEPAHWWHDHPEPARRPRPRGGRHVDGSHARRALRRRHQFPRSVGAPLHGALARHARDRVPARATRRRANSSRASRPRRRVQRLQPHRGRRRDALVLRQPRGRGARRSSPACTAFEPSAGRAVAQGHRGPRERCSEALRDADPPAAALRAARATARGVRRHAAAATPAWASTGSGGSRRALITGRRLRDARLDGAHRGREGNARFEERASVPGRSRWHDGGWSARSASGRLARRDRCSPRRWCRRRPRARCMKPPGKVSVRVRLRSPPNPQPRARGDRSPLPFLGGRRRRLDEDALGSASSSL